MCIQADPVTPALLRDNPLPSPSGHKDSRGRVVIVGGSRSAPGAVLLAGIGALRVGAGVLAMAVPDPVAIPSAIAVPEASVTGYPEDVPHDGMEDVRRMVSSADAISMGPGIDRSEQAQAVLSTLLGVASAPLVLDAFALGVLPGLQDQGISLPKERVLTPNPAEAAFLLNCEAGDLDPNPPVVAHAVAVQWQATVSYSGVIAHPDGRCFATGTGHAGVGTSGSGDVLAGCVTGLLARGVEPLWAAVWATYLHGAAGDRLAARVGNLGFLARELLDQVPRVLAELQA